MAGDWIKMRGNLWDDPRVAAIVDATDTSEAAVVGGLYWLWASADQHTEDGFMPGLSLRQIDRKTGVSGLGGAMVAVGWIVEEEGGIRIVRFTEHNGKSAKQRCEDAKRKATSRKVSEKCPETSGQKTDKSGQTPELEKEKEIDQEQKQKKGRASAPACPEDVEPQVWADWLALRRAKRAPPTETVIREARREAAKAGMTFAAFLAVWCRRGSQGLEADWLKPSERTARAGPVAGQSKTLTAIQTLQAMKNGNLDSPRDSGRPEQAALPVAGTLPGR